ncbi:MAG TPA: YCF48-related protein [Edaphocola sp.]|nr:YCF48-related protein [Edaphocola sp.]
MKKIFYALYSLIAAICLSATVNAQWTVQSESPSMSLGQLTVLGEDTVFVSGNESYILKSTDAGIHWDTLSFNNSWDFKIQFINDSMGFTGGMAHFPTGSTYFKTLDCGQTWQPMNFWAGGGFYFHTLCFLNEDTGFVSNGMNLYKTYNGGDSFKALNLPISLNNITAIHFVSEQVGFLAGWYIVNNQPFVNALFKTTDQGEHWSVIHRDTGFNNQQFVYSGVSQIYFSNIHTGYATGLSGYFLKTTDGGQTWQKILLDDENSRINQVDFVQQDTGYAAIYPDLYQTTDGGQHWQKLSIPDGTDAGCVQFINRNIGYISGHKLCKTTSGTGTGIRSAVAPLPLQVYPNPTRNTINLQYDNLHIQSLTLTGLSGRVIKTFPTENKTLNVSGIAMGMYFLQVKAEKGELVEKIEIR